MCVFDYFEKPREYSIEKFGKYGIGRFFISLSTKYLHPHLYLIATDGEMEVGKTSPVIKLHLFPNRKMIECVQVGTVLIKPMYDANIDLPPLLSSGFKCCPTMIISAMANKHSENIKLFSSFLKTFSDAQETLQILKKHKRDRLTGIRLDFSYMKKERNGNEKAVNPLSDEEAIELAKIVLKPNKTEIPAFLHTWEETVEYLNSYNEFELMSIDDFLIWFNLIFETNIHL